MKKIVAAALAGLALAGLTACGGTSPVEVSGVCKMDQNTGDFSVNFNLGNTEDGLHPVTLSYSITAFVDGEEASDSGFSELSVYNGRFHRTIKMDYRNVVITDCTIFDKGEGEDGTMIGTLQIENSKSLSDMRTEYREEQAAIQKKRDEAKARAEAKRKAARERALAKEKARAAAVNNELTTYGASGMNASQMKEKFGAPLHTQEMGSMTFWYYEQTMPDGKTLNAQVVFESGVVTTVNRSIYDFSQYR